MTEHKAFEDLQEALLRLERARQRERQRVEESDAILAGLSDLVGAGTRDEVAAILERTLRALVGSEHCWLLEPSRKGLLCRLQDKRFPIGERFARVLEGDPLNAFNVAMIPEWRDVEHRDIVAALHLPIRLQGGRGMVILTSSRPAAFPPSAVELAQRVLPFVEQAMAKIEMIELERARELAEQRRLMELVLEYAPGAIWMLDREGRLLFANPRFYALLGARNAPSQAEAASGLATKLTQAEQACLARKAQVHMRLNLEDGRILDVVKVPLTDAQGEVTGLIGIAMDVSEQVRVEQEREEMERKLLHAQKLESLGVLAGGIAHDFNNILSAIMGHAEMARRRAAEGPAAMEMHYSRIVEAADRAANLCRQMLAYSGKGKFVVKSLDLSESVRAIADMLQVSLNKGVVLKLALHEPLPHIEADPSQLQQVVMNLITNANEAIGARSGIIALRTGIMRVDKAYLRHCAVVGDEAEPGGYVFLEVSDTGCGMDAETRARIFDPFYTTKSSGRGLGMSAVSGIVRGHRGALRVYSEPGQGTTIRVLFPALDFAPEAIGRADGEKSEQLSSEPTILVVDDEETLREMAAMILKDGGCTRVLTARDGLEALQLFEAHAKEIGCVLLDLTMPHMSGEEVFRRIRAIDPDARVIICSGYSESSIRDRFAGRGVNAFLQKPYMPQNLLDAVEKVLNGA
ncbi:MAG: response regulator [Zetaproteobacteria bacterium]|nr:MAG: response regulator [Zetaproteobacteria bacterium]